MTVNRMNMIGFGAALASAALVVSSIGWKGNGGIAPFTRASDELKQQRLSPAEVTANLERQGDFRRLADKDIFRRGCDVGDINYSEHPTMRSSAEPWVKFIDGDRVITEHFIYSFRETPEKARKDCSAFLDRFDKQLKQKRKAKRK